MEQFHRIMGSDGKAYYIWAKSGTDAVARFYEVYKNVQVSGGVTPLGPTAPANANVLGGPGQTLLGSGDGGGTIQSATPDQKEKDYLADLANYQAEFERAYGIPAQGRSGFQELKAQTGARDILAWQVQRALSDVGFGQPETYTDRLARMQGQQGLGTIPAGQMTYMGGLTAEQERSFQDLIPPGQLDDLRRLQYESAYGLPVTAGTPYQAWKKSKADEDALAWALQQALAQSGGQAETSYGQSLSGRGGAMPNWASNQYLDALTGMGASAEQDVYGAMAPGTGSAFGAQQFALEAALRAKGYDARFAKTLVSRYYTPEAYGQWEINPESQDQSYLANVRRKLGLG